MDKIGRKDFDGWIIIKKKIHGEAKMRAIKDGDVWWCAVGENVGTEICGKGKTFARPVLVTKKLNRYSFIGVPLTSKLHNGSWYTGFTFQGKKQTAVLAQMECISVHRLYNKMGAIPESDLETVRIALCDLISDKKYSLALRLGWTGIPESVPYDTIPLYQNSCGLSRWGGKWYNRGMLDVKFIRENLELVEKSAQEKGYKIDIKEMLEQDDQRKKVLTEVEELRKARNETAAKMKGGKPTPELIEEGKRIKAELAEKETALEHLESEVKERIKKIPNVIFDDVPLGGEEDSVEIKHWGENHETGVDHLDYAILRDWVDFERGAKVAGAKFYYLKDGLALLENALLQYGMQKVLEHGFTYMTVPDMVSSRILEGCGFNPRSSEQSDEYFIDGEDLAMIATAEMPLTGYHMDEIIDEDKLPLLYAGYSPCFRKEAGAYGKYTRGLFRVHQFNKLEMYVFCLPEKSKEMHEKLLEIEEEIWQGLGVPYRIINIAAGDLGAPAAKKYDMEYWSPVNQKYQEITSCSNCTDFQARAVNCRVRRKDGTVEFVHTLNGTAIPLARALVVMLENFATEGGKFKVPKVLQPYLGGKEEI